MTLLNYIVPICVSICLFSNIFTFIINPGIIYSNSKTDEKVYCYECKFLYPNENKKIEHCFICGVCICNLDHHCDVIGKCVGKYNMALFIIFVFSSFGFIFTFSSILMNLLKLGE